MTLLSGGIAGASSGSENAALKAGNFLKTHQRDDGGFGAKESTVTETSLAIMALKAAEMKLPKSKNKKSPIDYLYAKAPDMAGGDTEQAIMNTAQISHLIIALKIAGENPKDFAETDWVALLKNNQEKATGWFGNYPIDHMWAMLALAQVGEASDQAATKWLQAEQADNGGFSADSRGGMGSDTNSTALAIQALVAAGVKPSEPSVKKAIDYLKTQQNKDGGFPYVTPSEYGTDSDTTSTAWVLQALIAAGEDIEGKYWVKAAITPMGYLMSMQNANGAFAYQKAVPEDSQLCTAQAIPALMGKPFPLRLSSEPETAKAKVGETASLNTSALLLIALMVISFIAAAVGAILYFFKGKNV